MEEVDVLVVLGSISDREHGETICKMLKELGVKCWLTVASAHRSPDRVKKLVEEAEERGVKVFIAVAGLSAMLPGLIAAYTVKPVISLPLSRSLTGLDALLSSVQSPPGVPVACVGIDNPVNAAILATEIVGLSRSDVRERLVEYRANLKRKVEEDARVVEDLSNR
ncbi:MAG: 5-(carboxyamino)imidazole ribonucleotide mutase [Nitrososphaerota archaeon]|nr:5-(carboxyamino)imidazole ribonucleotide mutase [Nitrososphaerota archaeon]